MWSFQPDHYSCTFPCYWGEDMKRASGRDTRRTAAQRSPERTRAAGIVPHAPLNARSREPLYEQLYRSYREAIVDGRLIPGSRLASTRVLAGELGVSRFTVVNAIERLRAEGYLTARKGSGTFVNATLPDLAIRVRPRSRSTAAPQHLRASPPRLSARGSAMSKVVITGPRPIVDEPRAFRPRRPPLDAFPYETWARLVRKQWGKFRHQLLDYGDPAGFMPLRRQIAQHVATTRGVRCTADQVIVTSGSQQAFDILFRLLMDPGDAAWMEDPGYLDVRGALVGAGARIVPVRVDERGMDIERGIAAARGARLAVVSPSHQYPTGATLSAERRLELLDWAYAEGSWIVEDDYDSYFRYAGQPLSALQQLDVDRLARSGIHSSDGRVVYVGTFSKTLFPSLRIGFCVGPPSLVSSVANARAIADRNSPIADQAVLAEFIASGQYDRHLRRIRLICAERYEAVCHYADRELRGRLRLQTAAAGTHVLGWLEDARHDNARRMSTNSSLSLVGRIAKHATDAGLVLFRLSRYSLTSLKEDGLVLGYGGLSTKRIAAGMQVLAKAFDTAEHEHARLSSRS